MPMRKEVSPPITHILYQGPNNGYPLAYIKEWPGEDTLTYTKKKSDQNTEIVVPIPREHWKPLAETLQTIIATEGTQ